MYGELNPSLIRLGMIVSVHLLTTYFSCPFGAETAALARLPAGTLSPPFARCSVGHNAHLVSWVEKREEPKHNKQPPKE